jgi:hypothetical protein
MSQYNLTFKLYALRVKADKLSECVALHPPWKDEDIKQWERNELALTLQQYQRLKKAHQQKTTEYNDKDTSNKKITW